MNISREREKCCGCGNCATICSKNAIIMKPDNNGFIYPQIDLRLCVNCSLCIEKCPVEVADQEGSPKSAFYGWINDNEIRMKSSSGGAFSAFANYILSLGGIVYGAAYDFNKKILRYSSTEFVDIDELRRSKYTECYIGDMHQKLKCDLEKGKPILVCGTPCHIAGIRKLFGDKYPNLYLIDFVCGGSSSPAFFKEYLTQLEEKNKSTIKKVNFRDKKWGWKRMVITVELSNNKKKSSISYANSYFTGFIEGISKRENCYSCVFSDNHYSDITIADYWGYKTQGVKYDPKGISMIVVNTDKGKNLKINTEGCFHYNVMDLKRIRYTIRPRVMNAKKLKENREFFALAKEIGYENAAKKTYMKNYKWKVLKSYLHL